MIDIALLGIGGLIALLVIGAAVYTMFPQRQTIVVQSPPPMDNFGNYIFVFVLGLVTAILVLLFLSSS